MYLSASIRVINVRSQLKKSNDTYARYEDSLNPCRVLTTVAYHSSIERATKRDVRENESERERKRERGCRMQLIGDSQRETSP